MNFETIKEIDLDLVVDGLKYSVFSFDDEEDYFCCQSTEKPNRENIKKVSKDMSIWGLYYSKGFKVQEDGNIKEVVDTWITRNGSPFLKLKSEKMDVALAEAQVKIEQLQNHVINFKSKKWKSEIIKRKIKYKGIDSVIAMIYEREGTLIIRPEEDSNIDVFLNDVFIEENKKKKRHLKTDYLDPFIKWYCEVEEIDDIFKPEKK